MNPDPRPMRTVVLTLAALAVIGAVGGVATVGFGLYNVSARAGHWPGVSWVLNTTFRNSTRLRAPEGPVPDLGDPQMVALGARHYETACAVCHGSPAQERSGTTRAMVPVPPAIAKAAARWTDPHDFKRIVADGIKMSAMPYWPAARTDDTWPVVAFLMQVEAMDAAAYTTLMTPAPGTDTRLARTDPMAYCASCHGRDGQSGNSQIPRLDILSERYMKTSLDTYRTGDRQSGIMRQAASLFPPETLADLAEEFAAMPESGARMEFHAEDPLLVAEGEQLATAGTGRDDIPACAACHGPWPTERSDDFPRIAGQGAAYLKTQLTIWRDHLRGGGPRAPLMRKASETLTDKEIDALAAYYANLAPSQDGMK